MPPLPAKPGAASSGWTRGASPTELAADKQGVSAKVVMHHFARGEVRNLNKGADDLHAQVVAKLRTLPEFRKAKDSQLLEVIKQITYRMQSADLTINFNAANWFRAPNTSRAYTQMYERGARTVTTDGGKKELRIAGNAMNPAKMRDGADTKVTFAANSDTPDMEGVARFMKTGGLRAVPGSGTEFTVPNRHFNPKARQNFAALNYGRMPGGPASSYGLSFMALRDGLKTNAIYYLGDTFKPENSAATRATYGTLFSLILYAGDVGIKAILDSCYRGMRLATFTDGNNMIEAHIFDEIMFHRDIKEMFLSRAEIHQAAGNDILNHVLKELPGPQPDRDGTISTIFSNAKTFCQRNGITLTVMD
jgi:hypothetical protein